MLTIKSQLDDTVELSLGGASVRLTAHELDAQIAELANARAKMSEQVPREPTPVGRVMVNPRYMVRTDKQTKCSLLRIRHSGFGWLDFELAPAEALAMKIMWYDIVQGLGLNPPEDFYQGPERRKPH